MFAPPQPTVVFVDSEPTLIALLDQLDKVLTQPSLFLDLEGIRLGRSGSISLLSLYLLSQNTVYLVDVHCLRQAAFCTTNANKTSLKRVLESTSITKVVFDVRNDSDALFSHYQIYLSGIKDIQLMELGSRAGSRAYVAGLAKCIEIDAEVSSEAVSEWRRKKEFGTQLFAPEQGGRYEVFNERPLRPELIQYCAQDVALLPRLLSIYEAKLRPAGKSFWRAEIEKATKERIELSHRASYDPHGQQKSRGPWSQDYIDESTEAWNDDILDQAMMEDNEGDDWDEWESRRSHEFDDYDSQYPDTARDCIG